MIQSTAGANVSMIFVTNDYLSGTGWVLCSADCMLSEPGIGNKMGSNVMETVKPYTNVKSSLIYYSFYCYYCCWNIG